MTAEELLAAMAEPLAEDGTYCTIDPETRAITIPPEYQLLGVESDEKAERIYFKCPKIVGDDIDLSKLALRVNFRNAGQAVDQYLVDDVAVDGDNITFSWLLSRRVTQYEGDVNFIVCAVRVSGETITNEWNTTLATAQVLEGLEAEVVLPEDETDIVNQLLALAETRLNDVREATADANTAASNANQKAQEAENAAEDARSVIEQITKDSYLHTALQSFVDSVKASPTSYGNAIAKKIEGFTRQETTQGLNLADYTGELRSCSLVSAKDMSFRSNINGQYYSEIVILSFNDYLLSHKGQKLTMSCEGNPSDKQISIIINGTGVSNGYIEQSANGNKVTITISEEIETINNVLLRFNRSTTTFNDTNTVIKHLMLYLGDEETSVNFEPYTGGQPAPNPDYPQIVHGVGDMGFFDGELLQGYYQASDGTFKPATVALCNKNPIPCKPGDKIIFEYEDVINGSGISIFFYKSDGTFISRVFKVGVRKIEGVAPQDTTYCNIVINPTSEPIPVASAKHITVTINDKYAVCVKSKGKNLLDFEGFLNSRGSRYTKCGDRYRITGTGLAYSNPILLSDEDEDFTLTGSVTSESGNGYSVQLLNNAGNVVAFIRDDTKKASGKGCKIRLNYVSAGAVVYEDIMLCEEQTDKYHSYQSNVTYIPVDYPLFEGDKIVQRNGEYKLVRKWGFKTYDGSDDENWNIVYNEENNVYNIYIADMTNDGKRGALVPNNYFYNSGYGYALHSSYISSSGNYNIIISPDMHIDAVQEWKDWLKTHTMYCVYELATPTEETLSPEAQKALHSIMATDEQTELTIVGVPSDAEIQNQFLLPRNEDGALNTTAYCTAEKNKIVLNELVAQNLDARVNKLEIDNATLAEQTIIVE